MRAPVISVNFTRPKGRNSGSEESERGSAVLALRRGQLEYIWGRALLEKGVDSYPVNVAEGVIAFAGRRKLVLKNDGAL